MAQRRLCGNNQEHVRWTFAWPYECDEYGDDDDDTRVYVNSDTHMLARLCNVHRGANVDT